MESRKCSDDISGTVQGVKCPKDGQELLPDSLPSNWSHWWALAMRQWAQDPILNDCIISTKIKFWREHFLGKVPNHNLHGTKSQHRAYAAEGTHLIWRSPVLSTQQQGLLPSNCTENSTAQTLMFRHLPENSVLQRSFSSTRTVPILPIPKKGTDTFPGVQILQPLFSVLAYESDVLLVHSRRNIYTKTKSMGKQRRRNSMIWLHFLLHHWLTGVSEALVSAAKGTTGKYKCYCEVHVQNHNKEWKMESRTGCPQCSGEGVGGGQSQGHHERITHLPRKEAWGTHALLLMLAKNDRLATF